MYRLLTFSKLTFSKNSFGNTISVKHFRPRSGPTFCRSWSGSKLFAKVISRRQVTVQRKSQGHHHRRMKMAAITHPTDTRNSHRLLRLWCKYPNTFPRPFNLSEYEVIAIMASCIRGSRGRTAITHQCQADPLAPNVCSVSIAGIFPRCCTICCFCARGRDSNQLFDSSYIDCERVLNSEKYNIPYSTLCMLGYCSCFCCCLMTFFKIIEVFKN